MSTTFPDWLANKLGTRLWVVAPRLTVSLAQHYDLAITRKQFTALREEYLERRRYAAKRASHGMALLTGNDRPWLATA
jgi:type IV secretory pathway TrbD component